MNCERFVVFTLSTLRETALEENMFTSYFNARLEMHRIVKESDVICCEIYEDSIGLSGRKRHGLVDRKRGKSVFNY